MTHKEQERVKMGINDDGLGAHSAGSGFWAEQFGVSVCLEAKVGSGNGRWDEYEVWGMGHVVSSFGGPGIFEKSRGKSLRVNQV